MHNDLSLEECRECLELLNAYFDFNYLDLNDGQAHWSRARWAVQQLAPIFGLKTMEED